MDDKNNYQKIGINNGQNAQNVNTQNYFENVNIIISEPIEPIASLKYYNFRDKFIISYIAIPSIIAMLNLFYPLTWMVTLVCIAVLILLQMRILEILDVINIYNNFFIINGSIIPFKNIHNIEIEGLGMKISYTDKKGKIHDKKLAFLKDHELKKFEEQYNKFINSTV